MNMKNTDEEKCGKLECGECKIPNPMNTNTKKKAQFGLSILFSPKYQSSIVNAFKDKYKDIITANNVAKERLTCEYNRVKKILAEKYNVNVKKAFQWKV